MTNQKKSIAKKDFKDVSLSKSQKIYSEAIETNTITICYGPAGTSKAQPLDSKILTPNGWVDMGSIKVGDIIYSEKGEKINVIGVFPQGKKEVYKVTMNDGSYTECCDDHLWLTKTYSDRIYESKKGVKRSGTVKTLKDIRETLKYKGRRPNHEIPVVSPISFESKNLPLDPYSFGLLLGDGGFRGGRVSFGSSDVEAIKLLAEGIEKIDCILRCDYYNKLGDRTRERPTNKFEIEYKDGFFYSFTIVSNNKENKSIKINNLINIIRGMNLFDVKSTEKFIPESYKYSKIEDRISLLKGIMDSDGSIGKKGKSPSIGVSSLLLSKDIVELVNSLGGICTTKERKTYRNVSYHITINMGDINPFRLERKNIRYSPPKKYKPKRFIEKIEKVGEKECQCIKVDNPTSLYVTDFFIVTHNTFSACYTALKMLEKGEIKKIILTKPIQESGEKLGYLPGNVEEKIGPFMESYVTNFQKIITKEKFEQLYKDSVIEFRPLAYMRGATFDECVMILDEAQNCDMKTLMLFVTRLGDGSKMILMGDTTQHDIDYKKVAIPILKEMIKGIPRVGAFEFSEKDIVRDPILIEIVKRYEAWKIKLDSGKK